MRIGESCGALCSQGKKKLRCIIRVLDLRVILSLQASSWIVLMFGSDASSHKYLFYRLLFQRPCREGFSNMFFKLYCNTGVIICESLAKELRHVTIYSLKLGTQVVCGVCVCFLKDEQGKKYMQHCEPCPLEASSYILMGIHTAFIILSYIMDLMLVGFKTPMSSAAFSLLLPHSLPLAKYKTRPKLKLKSSGSYLLPTGKQICVENRKIKRRARIA